MKYLILIIDAVAWNQYKGARNNLDMIACEIAKFNSQSEEIKAKTMDDFLVDLFKIVNKASGYSKIELEKLRDAAYRFGSTKTKGNYVQYGEIIKTALL